MGGLQYVLSRGQRLDWFDSDEIVVISCGAALAFYIFVVHSLTTEKPFLDLRLLGNRNLALGYILVSLFGMLAFTPMVLLPTLLRQYAEYPDALVGWVVGSRGIAQHGVDASRAGYRQSSAVEPYRRLGLSSALFGERTDDPRRFELSTRGGTGEGARDNHLGVRGRGRQQVREAYRG